VWEVIKNMRLAVTPQIATALLLGIYTDTDGFKHNNSTKESLQLASLLVRRGANLRLISQTCLRTLPKKQQRLWGLALSKLDINSFGLAITKINHAELEAHHATSQDLAGLANLIALTSEAMASLVLIENKSVWQGILRTRHHQINVGKLARLIGGSGSKKAAGFTVTKDIF
jgi:phosphoesterase RecJ-like protein